MKRVEHCFGQQFLVVIFHSSKLVYLFDVIISYYAVVLALLIRQFSAGLPPADLKGRLRPIRLHVHTRYHLRSSRWKVGYYDIRGLSCDDVDVAMIVTLACSSDLSSPSISRVVYELRTQIAFYPDLRTVEGHDSMRGTSTCYVYR